MPQLSAHAVEAPAADIADRFLATRALSEALVEPLSEGDATIQSMEDASPAKWHLAHTTWFWETFLLRDHKRGYALYDERWPFLFNSYYEAEGARHPRAQRGVLSRPSVAEILEWRAHVDCEMEPLLGEESLNPLITLGITHEEQHQELLLSDNKHAMFLNPTGPAIWKGAFDSPIPPVRGWIEYPGGIARIGHEGAGFAFDNEGPAHRVLLEPFALARSLVTNGEWEEFIADGGYRNVSLWLSDGWAWVQANSVEAPLYWRNRDGEPEQFTHCGWQRRDPDAPVAHISYYEADAYAQWAGARLPTEFEWEAIAASHDAAAGNQLDGAAPPVPIGGGGLFGDVWQWTRSAYSPYPRFAPAAGTVGEYNGKFMSGQFVLRGASCATVRGHSRSTYRNFFYPHQRWIFTGLRLARDLPA